MNPRRQKWIAPVLGLVLILSMVAGPLGQGAIAPAAPAQAQDGPVPRFEPAACMFDLPDGYTDGDNVECGYLVVPEDRADPASPPIRLAVAIFKSLRDDPGPPMIRLDGGPGGHSLGNAGEFLNELSSTAPLLARGDLILVDQRGVGFSEPSLSCGEIENLTLDTLAEDLRPEDEALLLQAALEKCRTRLANEGVNLDAYNSAANAADINDLWRTLGYDTVNVYGVSYGTRLALTMMRDYPDGIRSVILDSAFPLQANLYVDIGTHAQRAFDLIFDGCAADAACSAAFPNLEKRFYETVDRLNDSPEALQISDVLTGDTYDWLLTGDGYFDLIFNTLYVSSLIGFIPAIMEATASGDYQLISLLASVFELDFTIDFGMYWSVQCAEEVPFQELSAMVAAEGELTAPFQQWLANEPLDVFETCRIWGVEPTPGFENEAVTSDIPTLIVAGEYDPITPPAYGAATAETLENSYFFVYPGLGHGVFDEGGCPLSITLAFVDDPLTEPDSSCIDEMTLEYLIP